MADVFQPNYDAARTLPRSVTLVTSRNLICRPDEAGVPLSWLPPLAAKAPGAGFLLRLLGVRYLGIAAEAILVLFFTGALAARVRACDFHNIAYPAAYLALASHRRSSHWPPPDSRPPWGNVARRAALTAVEPIRPAEFVTWARL